MSSGQSISSGKDGSPSHTSQLKNMLWKHYLKLAFPAANSPPGTHHDLLKGSFQQTSSVFALLSIFVHNTWQNQMLAACIPLGRCSSDSVHREMRCGTSRIKIFPVRVCAFCVLVNSSMGGSAFDHKWDTQDEAQIFTLSLCHFSQIKWLLSPLCFVLQKNVWVQSQRPYSRRYTRTAG